MQGELPRDELKAALAAADRGMRLPLWELTIVGAIGGTAIGIALKHFDSGDPVHVLIACAVVLLYAWGQGTAGILQARQNAANARMLRALELLDEKLSSTSPPR